MHTEHLQNVRPAWVLFGWFVSVAVVSLFGLVLAAAGMVDPDASPTGGLWGVIAIVTAFFLGGLLTGARVGAAPILHGVGMGLVSLLVWFVANLSFGEALDATTWSDGSPAFYAGSLILQMVAATLGARAGSRQLRRVPGGG